MNTVDRARAYLSKLPPAIAGDGGHGATLNAACRLVEFGLGWHDAWPVLMEWNLTHCDPPWTERELTHKLKDAFRRTRAQERFTCPGPNALAGAGAWKGAAVLNAGAGAAADAAVLAAPLARAGAARSPGQARLADLSRMTLAAASSAQLSALATLREVSVQAAALAAERGLLSFGSYRGRCAWFILDKSRRVVQARRLDGKPWTWSAARPALPPCQHSGGGQQNAPEAKYARSFGGLSVSGAKSAEAKALNLPGSNPSWPVGVQEATPYRSIALCEGGPDLLAALHFLIEQGKVNDCAPVAMLGAGAVIQEQALPLFEGKRVRIFAHADATGAAAVLRWTTPLALAGADVDAFSFTGLRQTNGQAVKDFNDLVRVCATDLAKWPCLKSLFP